MNIRVLASSIILCLIFVLAACNSSSNKQVDAGRVVADKTSTADSAGAQQVTDTFVAAQNCTRGQAAPVLRKEVYPNAKFELQSDSLNGIETLAMDSGDMLTIKNWGCEYYVLTFRFETSRYKADTADLYQWFTHAKGLVTGMLAGIDAPVDIKRGLVFLDGYILRDAPHKYKDLALGEKIYYGESDIKSFVSVDSVEQLSAGRFAVEISFGTGPL